ncbi:MAG TPA: phage tail tape measure protein [Chitinophagaceae bacterium]|nr:phage tail tape measure protein [Chitinophagaceae bacterium]
MISLGGQSQLGIGIAISLNNQFSGQARAINQQLIDMRRNALTALSSAARDYRNHAAGIAATAAAITGGMISMAKKGAEFQHKINQSYIVGGQSLGRSKKELASFAKQMSRTFTRDPKEIAQVMFENIKAGVSSGLEEITKYQTAVAAATDEALGGAEGVGEKLLGITNAMGMRAMDTVEIAGKQMTQFARVSNATTAAANATMASVYSIGESMEYFSNTAAHAGMTLEQTLALVGKLSQAKITGAAAGTALNNMVQQLINSVGPFMTPKKKKAFDVLGIDPKAIQAMINQGQTYEAIEMIERASQGLSRTDRLTTFNALFNMRGQRGIVNAFAVGEKSLADIHKEIERGVTGDVVMQQAKAMMGDLYSDFKFLSNAFDEFKIAFTKAIEPAMKAGIKVATKVLRIVAAFVDTPVGKVLMTIVAVTAPMVAVMFAFRAAVLTATLAMQTMSRMAGVGGFAGLTGGMMGMWGMGRAGAAGVAGVGRNAAGRFYVTKGNTLNYGGKLYKGGQFLPKAFSAGGIGTGFSIGSAIGGMFGMGGRAGAAASSGAVVGTLGKIATWAGRIASFGLRWLPVVGWIWTAVELLRGIFGNSEEEKMRNDPDAAATAYLRALHDHMIAMELGNTMAGNKMFSKYMNMKWGDPNGNTQLNQTLNINLDGRKMFSEDLKTILDRASAAQTEFNFAF